MSTEKGNLNISGSGSYPGGIFENIRISGTGKILGDVKCNKLSASGTSKVEGNVVAQSISISGTGKVLGNIEVAKMSVSGTLRVEGDVSGGSIGVSGAGKVFGNIKCEKVSISGAITIEKNIEAEEVTIQGSIKNNGFINAEKVVINTRGAGNGYTKFNEIGATTVAINNDQSLVSGIFSKFMDLFSQTNRVEGHVIEGDETAIVKSSRQI